MKKLKSYFFLFVCLGLGSLLGSVIDYPIPDMIYGFVILFIFLILGIAKLKDMETASVPLIRLMPLFLVPATVKIVNSFPLIKSNGFRLFIVLMISFFCTLVAVALTVKFLRKIQNGK
jgi:holin-like protein